ncbi:3-hexulose-6-phosphate isomerase [Roseobacter fucihabitans]|uniref:3-hexulose-6-phosphate isomerase n=1 Tax=Roseobacter fucihabitans TaxID=1537242 RepID=A0ABZ2BWB3_9RHOB|nr:SIS domain-containing protein [Roseobacter litoralis]MBC6966084.1 3-hexulose-6-phosphate isomerase [Roseobacter litoralis]
MTLKKLASRAITEIGAVLDSALPHQVEVMAAPILNAKRIALYGVGREGLMMKSLAMRLFHLGLDAHVVGDMTTPPLGTGDMLIVSAGPGEFSTVSGLIDVAKTAGAATMCVTATPDGTVPQSVTHVVHLEAQTMANDQEGATSVLPMGSLFEAVQFLFFEMVILHLRDQMGLSANAMRANHTNLE